MNLKTFAAVLSLCASAAAFGCSNNNSTTPIVLNVGGSGGQGGAGGVGGVGGMGGEGEPIGPDSFGGKLTCDSTINSDGFSRTELFFGLSRSGGPNITEAEFSAFVDAEVTPRFPDGLTIASGRGQYRGDGGVLTKEGSKLLVLLHGGAEAESAKIEEIRAKYKQQFMQESVLRTDSLNCVAF